MKGPLRRTVICIASAIAVSAIMAPAASAEKVTLLALFRDKAIVLVAGARHVVDVGETTPEGVRLLEANTEFAVIEIDGRTETLYMKVVSAPIGADAVQPPQAESVTLWQGPGGFFEADGSINGYPVRFLVDTGASSIALSSETARRIGIDFSKGNPGMAQTASGLTPMVRVVLDTVAVGGISMRDVEAGVLMGNYPTQPLLGGSFLAHVDMVRRGQRLELIKRPYTN